VGGVFPQVHQEQATFLQVTGGNGADKRGGTNFTVDVTVKSDVQNQLKKLIKV
jgi:hypothetical protein